MQIAKLQAASDATGPVHVRNQMAKSIVHFRTFGYGGTVHNRRRCPFGDPRMTSPWLRFGAIAALCLGSSTALAAPEARTYPTKPVTLLVPFTPGGSIDVVARLLGRQLTARMG